MDDLRELYQEVILDHGKHPRNKRHPEHVTHEAHGNNPLCGDKVTIYLAIGEGERIEDVAFEGRGCAISTASASLMTEIVKGKTEAEARALFERFHQMCTDDAFVSAGEEEIDPESMDRLQVMAGIRQFPMRVKCATLPWHTLNAAMAGKDKASTE